MAPAAEDVLGELYAWDSVIEDDSSMSADDPQRDEDKTEDAYEQIIHTASGDASDIVLSLAAQLLHKHFFRFPHVQINVIEVLLKLCGPKRSQAVRIHTLRALLQIAKTPPAAVAASTPTSAASIARKNTRTWLQHIYEAVQHMLETEKSSVILRQVTPLRQALEEKLLPESDEQPNKSKTGDSCNINDGNDNSNDKNSETSPSELNHKKARDVMDAVESEEHVLCEPEPKKAKYDDETRYQAVANPKEGKIVQLNRESSNVEGLMDSWKKPLSNSRLNENEGRRSKVNAFSPRNCPPCPYLFLGSVPRHTPNAEIVEYLSPVWPSIDSMSVQIKQPDHNATAYAFVSMPSIEHAREAIHYVAANKFRGRTSLNANFARGPPVDTVLFVERTSDDVNMEDKGAVREFDFTKCDPDVWNILCQQLERFGPLDFAENGCVRFRSSEHAKAVIRKQIFSVKGYEIYPVYDTKEQFAIDSTRRGPNAQKQGFTLKSGRLVGGDSDYSGSKKYYSSVENDTMNSRRERGREMSLKYTESNRSLLRNDRGSARRRSRSRSPNLQSRGRYDGPMGGLSRERRQPLSRSRSPVPFTKKKMMLEGGYGSPPDKENRREFRSKGGRRSYSPVNIRSHESSAFEEMRGRPREREGPWIDARSIGGVRDSRQMREEGLVRGKFRGASPSPSSSSRRNRKDDRGSQRSGNYQRGSGPIEDVRQSHCREGSLPKDRGRTHVLSGGVMDFRRSRSRSPPKYGKYAAKNRPRSRSQSPVHQEMRKGTAYRGRDEHSLEPSDDRPSVQMERPRYADNRSIAEVARDEQQERQRYFQQKQGRRDVSDAELSRYGAGRGGGHVGDRGRGDRYQAQQPHKGNRGGAMYQHDVPLSKGSARSPPPSSTRQRSLSPPPHARQRSFSPDQPRKSYSREGHREIAPRGHECAYSPPRSPRFQNIYGPVPTAPSDHHEFDHEADDRMDRVSSNHERRHHSSRGRSRDEKSRRIHRDHQDIRLPRPERSLTPSPVHREHISGSSGRKSNGHSPRRSFHRRIEDNNQSEEGSGPEKQTRLKKEDESHPEEKEIKSGGARLARDELFAGMDDLTVDYEEDDE
ncbi:hypothetical protein PsorP6_001258 [Peronosclerospora sorghi]|uniref:Uncharacterized protein n=1 Tax=Peronosclerospora sorghi TaxID=230839 RepID=A0ACC0WWP6_9STRA|nr:hypothetical protein PsorP6_001258 [Peronosclerospora sorghi]